MIKGTQESRSPREEACYYLSERDERLAEMVDKNGLPPVWERNPGFESLVRIILEQAVSLESAKAVFDKLFMEIGEITPDKFLKANESIRERAGFSRVKWKTCRICAEKVQLGELTLDDSHSDENQKDQLLGIPGIGPWTVHIYQLLVLQRVDVWPIADRALQVAVSESLGLSEILRPEEMLKIADPWRPYRSWAARIFWHDYLIRRNRIIRF